MNNTSNEKKYCQCGCGKEIGMGIYHRGHYPRTIESRRKYKQTCLERYNAVAPMKNKDIMTKSRETLKRKYGVTNWGKTAVARNQRRDTANRLHNDSRRNGESTGVVCGDNERPFMSELERIFGYKIIRNDLSFIKIANRKTPDGYIADLNLIIQFDERVHFEDWEQTIHKQVDFDTDKCFTDLGYNVIRVAAKEWKENKESAIRKFQDYIVEFKKGSNNG